MKIWHISDTHTYNELLTIPKDIDIVIHSGDMALSKDRYNNEPEVRNFIDWYSSLPIKYKIVIAGNHDTSIEANLVTKRDFANKGVIYLENNSVEIEGLKIWGSPITPTFGTGWAFNKNRAKIHKTWDNIPDDCDIIVTHGPAKGILDLSYSPEGILEFCGCSNLRKRILKIEPKLFLFGHIHNTEDIINAGYTKLSKYKTIFSNGTVVTDGKFGKVSSNGNIFEI